MTSGRDRDGAVQLAEKLRQLRHAQKLTQEQLAERANLLDPEVSVSVDTVRALERTSRPRPLPARRPARGRFALESILTALDAELTEVLCECFSVAELLDSAFAWVVEDRADTTVKLSDVVSGAGLEKFIQSLPADADNLLKLPGLLQLRNETAFCYIFALESCYSGLEMLVVNEPPIILLGDEDIEQWADGMRLSGVDRAAFVHLVRRYQRHFLGLLRDRRKRYQIVLWKQGLVRFLRGKSAEGARALLTDMIALLRMRDFELVLLESPAELEEFEVLSVHKTIPTSLDDTISVVIRQTSMSSSEVEYILVPMPPSLSGLQRDIARIEQYWSLALDQYRALTRTHSTDSFEYWPDPSATTVLLLERLLAGSG